MELTEFNSSNSKAKPQRDKASLLGVGVEGLPQECALLLMLPDACSCHVPAVLGMSWPLHARMQLHLI